MIAKGNFHAHGGKLAAYLMKGKTGERAELVEMRGFAASDLRTAFRDIEIMGREGTKAQTAFFHTYVRLPEGERLDTEQWKTIADRIEKRLGFTGQARAISFHTDTKTGERHMHIAWSRIAQGRDGELFAIDPGLYKNKLKEISRTLEKELGLKQLSNERAPNNRARSADRREFEESRRLGTDINAIRSAILDSFEKSDSGKAFHAAIRAQGMELAQGDRRDCLVVIDAEGGQHALNKKLTGKTLAEIRQRLSDLDRSQLPSVDQAKEIQAERQAARERQERSQTRDHAGDSDRPPKSPTQSHGPENGRSVDFSVAAQEAAQRPERTAAAETRAGQQRASLAHEIASAPASEPAREITRAAGSIAAAVTNALGGFLNFFAGGAPKLTRQQVHDQQQAAGNVETQHAKAVDRHAAKIEAERDERISREDSEKQLPLAAPAYFRTVTRPADPAERQQQEQQRGRERERER